MTGRRMTGLRGLMQTVPLLLAIALAMGRGGTAEYRSCPPCSLRLDPVVSLGSLADPVGRSMNSLVARLSTGAYVLAPMFGAPQIATYDASGTFTRLYDQRGRGPGELSSFVLRLSAGPGDTIEAWTSRQRLRFNSQLEPLAAPRMQFSPRALMPLSGGALLVNHPRRSPSGVVHALHVLRGDSIVESFDTAVAPGFVSARAFGDGAGGTLWVARVNEPRVDLFDRTGRRLRTLHLDMPWFTPWIQRSDRAPLQEPPEPYQLAIRELDPTHLLVLTQVADSNWRPRPEALITSSTEWHSLFDTVLSLVDSGTGKVLASIRSDLNLRMVIGTANLVHAAAEVESGDIVERVWRVTPLTR